MSLSVEQFVEKLDAIGLLSADAVSRVTDSLPTGEQPADVPSLAKILIRQGKLTRYQATAVYQNKTKHLMFGEYVVVDKIGAGGMGLVLKAKHKRMKRTVAVKVLPAQRLKDNNSVERFYREVEAAARLTHPNIVHAYDAGEHEGLHFLVMEYVNGRDLAAIVHEHGPLPIEQAVECIRQAAQGLQYAHDEGIVHRDIKPGNLLLDKKGTVKILDMGLARLNVGGLGEGEEKQPEQLTQSGQIMGTVDYMAPEQAEDTRKADHRADIYALGCTLFRLVTGNSVYDRDTIMQKLLAHREDEIPSLMDLRPEVPVRLNAVFQRMVAKSPDDRCQSMAEVIEALQSSLVPATQAARPAAPKKDSSTNQALTAFFDKIGDEKIATKKGTTAVPEETIDRRPFGEDTGDRIAEVEPIEAAVGYAPRTNSSKSAEKGKERGAYPTKSRRQRLILRVGISTVALVLLVIIGFAISGRNGSDSASVGEVSSIPNYALQFDGKNCFVEIPNEGDPNGAITIEAFVEPDNDKPASILQSIVRLASTNGKWMLATLVVRNRGAFNAIADSSFQVGETFHVAGVRSGNQTMLFVNGQHVATASDPSSLRKLHYAQIGSIEFAGTIDEVRISSIARYDGDFTPPQPHERFTPDEHTLALYHCDEISGGKLIDSSDNGHHGTVHNCKLVKVEPVSNCQLELDEESYVDLPGINPPASDAGRVEALTVEAFVTPRDASTCTLINGTLALRVAYGVWYLGGNVHRQSGSVFVLSKKHAVEANRRIHMAGVCDGEQITLFVNGQRLGSASDASGFRVNTYARIGLSGFRGKVDEVRISNVARYTEDFTPPQPHERFTPDEHTLALYHCDEIKDGKLIDFSGNGHHGTVHNCKLVRVDEDSKADN